MLGGCANDQGKYQEEQAVQIVMAAGRGENSKGLDGHWRG